MKKFFQILFFVLISFSLFAQQKNDSTKIAKNTFFVEGLGNGIGWGSLNYDRILMYKNNFKISGRIGGIFVPRKSMEKYKIALMDNFWSAFFEINAYWGGRRNFELGTGFSHIYGIESGYELQKYGSYRYASSTLFLPIRIGYRFQKEEGGIFLKIGAIFLIKIYEFNPIPPDAPEELKDYAGKINTATPWVGLGIGYTLKNK